MARFFRLAAGIFGGRATLVGAAAADPDTTREGAYRIEAITLANAPAQDLLYVNDHGFWSIGPQRTAGQATYLWRGDPNYKSTDLLTYVGRAILADQFGARIHHGWVYQAMDHSGHAGYWFFAEAPVTVTVSGDPVYPLFYSTDPLSPEEATFHRYLTANGTGRW